MSKVLAGIFTKPVPVSPPESVKLKVTRAKVNGFMGVRAECSPRLKVPESTQV